MVEKQRGVADDQRRVGTARSIASRSGAIGANSGVDAEPLARSSTAQQRDRRPRAGVDRDRADARRSARAREERDRRDRALARRCRRPGTIWYGAGPRRYSIDGIMPTSIARVVQQRARTPTECRTAARTARCALQAVDQRPRVQVSRPRPSRDRIRHQRDATCETAVAFSTGSSPAARMLPRISSIGLRRRPEIALRAPTPRRRRRRPRSARPARASGRRAASRPGSTRCCRPAAAPARSASRRRTRSSAAATELTRGSGANARTPPIDAWRSRASATRRSVIAGRTADGRSGAAPRAPRRAPRGSPAAASRQHDRAAPRRRLEPGRGQPRQRDRSGSPWRRPRARAGRRASSRVTGTAAGERPRRLDRRRSRRRPTRASRRCESRRRWRPAGSDDGDASTWTSNTRTNVVRAP